MSAIGIDLPSTSIVIPAERDHRGTARRHGRHGAVGRDPRPSGRAHPSGRRIARRCDRAAAAARRPPRHRRRADGARHRGACSSGSSAVSATASRSWDSARCSSSSVRSCSGRCSPAQLSKIISAPLPRIKGMTGTLARENAARNPKRTATTATALVIGVALVGFITIFAASAKASIAHAIDSQFNTDFVVQGPGRLHSPASGSARSWDRRSPRFPRSRPRPRCASARSGVNGNRNFLSALDPKAADRAVRPRRRLRLALGHSATTASRSRRSKPTITTGSSATRSRSRS